MTLPAADAMIVLSCKRRAYRDSLRSYLVMLDGKQVAKVRRGGTVELPVPSGPHQVHIKMKMSMGRSPSIEFDAHAGEVIRLFAEPGGSAAAGLSEALSGPGAWISLTRV
jgi:hypothetical protein